MSLEGLGANEFYQVLGKRLRLVRELRHLSQAEVADIVGIVQHMISRYETGKHAVTLHRLYQLSEVYQVGAAMFLLSQEAFDLHLNSYLRRSAYLAIFRAKHKEKYG